MDKGPGLSPSHGNGPGFSGVSSFGNVSGLYLPTHHRNKWTQKTKSRFIAVKDQKSERAVYDPLVCN